VLTDFDTLEKIKNIIQAAAATTTSIIIIIIIINYNRV